MPINTSKVTIGIVLSVFLTSTASAQVLDDRFKPRVYGSLAVTPAQISPDAARISGLNETRNVIVTPTTNTYNAGRVIPSSSTSGTYTPQSYGSSAVEVEAQRVIAFQNANSGSISQSYTLPGAEYNVVPQERQYEVELFEPTVAPTYASTIAPVQNFATQSVQAHYVAEGETLYSISKRYNTSVDALRASNGLSGNVISIGQSLNIPSASQRVLASSQLNTVTQHSAPQSNLIRSVQPIPNRGVYAVLPKDTLYSISQRACVTVEGIQSRNGLGASTEIAPGQRLNMPAGHCLN